MENQQYMQEYDINLQEYIQAILKRKKLILAIFLVSVAASVVISLKMPKIYEINSTVQLGNLGAPLIGNEEATAMMLNRNLLQSAINDLGLNAHVESLQNSITIKNLAGTNLLKIKIVYPNIDAAIKINEAIFKPLIAQGKVIYQERLAIVNERLNEIEAEIKGAEDNINRTQALIAKFPDISSVSQSDIHLRIVLLQNIVPGYENYLTMLRTQRNDIKLLLANAKDFKIFDAPIRPAVPVGPSKKKNVIITGVLSVIVGAFLALVLETQKKSKKEKAK